MEPKKIKYTRAEKIAYYARRKAYLEMASERNKSLLAFANDRLRYLQSDEYQDWDSDLEETLKEAKNRDPK